MPGDDRAEDGDAGDEGMMYYFITYYTALILGI